MVRGLDVFTQWFKEFSDQYVLIGGTAASLAMKEFGVPFRGTKDLDVVLHLEALTPEFGEIFGSLSMRVAMKSSKTVMAVLGYIALRSQRMKIFRGW